MNKTEENSSNKEGDENGDKINMRRTSDRRRGKEKKKKAEKPLKEKIYDHKKNFLSSDNEGVGEEETEMENGYDVLEYEKNEKTTIHSNRIKPSTSTSITNVGSKKKPYTYSGRFSSAKPHQKIIQDGSVVKFYIFYGDDGVGLKREIKLPVGYFWCTKKTKGKHVERPAGWSCGFFLEDFLRECQYIRKKPSKKRSANFNHDIKPEKVSDSTIAEEPPKKKYKSVSNDEKMKRKINEYIGDGDAGMDEDEDEDEDDLPTGITLSRLKEKIKSSKSFKLRPLLKVQVINPEVQEQVMEKKRRNEKKREEIENLRKMVKTCEEEIEATDENVHEQDKNQKKNIYLDNINKLLGELKEEKELATKNRHNPIGNHIFRYVIPWQEFDSMKTKLSGIITIVTDTQTILNQVLDLLQRHRYKPATNEIENTIEYIKQRQDNPLSWDEANDPLEMINLKRRLDRQEKRMNGLEKLFSALTEHLDSIGNPIEFNPIDLLEDLTTSDDETGNESTQNVATATATATATTTTTTSNSTDYSRHDTELLQKELEKRRKEKRKREKKKKKQQKQKQKKQKQKQKQNKRKQKQKNDKNSKDNLLFNF